jgi:hypothetical protein
MARGFGFAPFAFWRRRTGLAITGQMTQFLLTTRCNHCSKHYPASRMIRYSNNVRVCEHCYQRHNQALDALAGKRMPECQLCHKTVEVLAAEQGTDNVSLVAHLADGVYAFFCHPCSDKYEQKRRDLYAETQYGHLKGISA